MLSTTNAVIPSKALLNAISRAVGSRDKKIAKLGFDVYRYCHRRAALQRILCDGLVLIIQHKCEIFVA